MNHIINLCENVYLEFESGIRMSEREREKERESGSSLKSNLFFNYCVLELC